jgi:hypothetical protein
VIAAVSIETNLIERERHRRRSKIFRNTLKQLQETMLAGRLCGADQLTSFGNTWRSWLWTLSTDQYVGVYQPLSQASAGDLLRRHIEDLELDDNCLALEPSVAAAWKEVQVGGLIWSKKAIRFWRRPGVLACPGAERTGPGGCKAYW